MPTFLRLTDTRFHDPSGVAAFAAQSLLIMSSILRLGKSDFPTVPIDADSFERIATCMRVLLEPNSATAAIFLNECHANYATLLTSQTVRRQCAHTDCMRGLC